MDQQNVKIAGLIMQRRRQIWIHSIIYYEFNDNIISDAQWSKWAIELEELQNTYPEISKSLPFYDIFKDFDHSTGYTLPLRDSKKMATANWLLDYDKKMKRSTT